MDSREPLESKNIIIHTLTCMLNCGNACCLLSSTPLIRLGKLSEQTGCTIAVKAEFLNPGGSVKDRAALYLIKDAEEKGKVCYTSHDCTGLIISRCGVAHYLHCLKILMHLAPEVNMYTTVYNTPHWYLPQEVNCFL